MDTPEIKELCRQHNILLGHIGALSRMIRSRKRQDIQARDARRQQRETALTQADAAVARIAELRKNSR